LGHYLKYCRLGTVSPIPEFDIHYYAKHSPDVVAAGVDPFEHYVSYGYTEGRAPSEAFDVRFYTKRYLEPGSAINPFIHWLENRDTPGVYGRMPDHETNIPREIKRFTRPSDEFEEFRAIPASATRHAKILALYLPQFHSFPENDAWWGRGFTEWTNIPRGIPRFRGHYQPRVPRDLGFYGLTEQDGTETLRRQAKMATDAGLHGFVFYFYWFNGKRLMGGPLERLLKDASIELPFALMWANENWTRRWDGAESEVLISQDYRPEDDEAMLEDFARHFKDRRYIRLEGRPLLMIYRPGLIPNGREAISRWREMFQAKFGENPIIFMAQTFGDFDPTVFGLDGAIEFPPHKLTQTLPSINDQLELLDPEFSGKVYQYDTVVRQSLDEPAPRFPLIKTAVPSWDNDARRQGTGLAITDSTPKKYQAWLTALIALARKRPIFGEPVVCVNAWNEWCEGAYLEPDLHFGAAYLNATSRAVVGMGDVSSASYKILLVGHDAFPSGSQQLLINLGRVLRSGHGVTIEYLLLDGGKLLPSYSEIAPTKVLAASAGLDQLLTDFASRGFVRAILNTSVSGTVAAALETHGILPEILLVHELPRILRDKHLIPNLTGGFKFARNVIFPARFVEASVCKLIGTPPTGNALVIPQGSYKVLSPSIEDIDAFRATLHLEANEPMVLGVGYADLRKGFDLFLQVWRLVNRERRVHFFWAGLLAPELEAWLGDEVAEARAAGTFHMPGFVGDMGPVFGASSMMLLTSREDPFPTVVLEALSLGKPVIAFANSGGMPELLSETGTGIVISLADTVGMAGAVKAFLEQPEPEAKIEQRRALVREQYSFPRYVERLMHIALPEMPTVSVAVPNYNYARYMPERLGSIFRQSHPVHEVIVLDDVSSDASVEVIQQVSREWKRDISLVVNTVNSGSVFEQWRKAAEMATGEWIWIAEADDSSDVDFLSRIMSVINGDPDVVMAFTDSRAIDEDGLEIWESYKGYYASLEDGALTRSEIFDGDRFVSRFLSVKNLILNVSAVVWRREALVRALRQCRADLGSYKMAGDWHLYIHALSSPGAKIAYESTVLNAHRRHRKSVTHALNAERHLGEIKRCHQFARSALGNLSAKCISTQESYLSEVLKQFGLTEEVG
jgi:glycosyltransferase involved in cell wall biosynthesis